MERERASLSTCVKVILSISCLRAVLHLIQTSSFNLYCMSWVGGMDWLCSRRGGGEVVCGGDLEVTVSNTRGGATYRVLVLPLS